jgi:hypothetical protein
VATLETLLREGTRARIFTGALAASFRHGVSGVPFRIYLLFASGKKIWD